MITFKNPGLLDLTAATTFGVSVKENENPIGYFGTGFKYAVAIILRLGGSIVLWRGNDRHEFTTQPQTIRGEEFNVVCLDGRPLGFTTRMGINWEPWQAFRELYCNALDEKGDAHDGTLAPVADCTTLHVAGLDACYAERHRIVLPPSDSVIKLDGVEIRRSASAHIYYRGVRVMALTRPAQNTYNLTGAAKLTEDRTLAEPYIANSRVANAIVECTDRGLIEEFVTAPQETFEGHSDLEWSAVPSDEFLEVVGALRKRVDIRLNVTALKIYSKHRADRIEVEEFKPNEIEQKQIDKALTFLSLIGHRVNRDSIKLVDDLGQGGLGRALIGQKTILISRRCFEMGTKYVAGTILEEHIHITRKYSDMTRELQNYLFDQIISIGERFVGEPL